MVPLLKATDWSHLADEGDEIKAMLSELNKRIDSSCWPSFPANQPGKVYVLDAIVISQRQVLDAYWPRPGLRGPVATDRPPLPIRPTRVVEPIRARR